MTPQPSPWTRLRAAIDPLTRRTLGLYAAYTIDPEEYVANTYLPLGIYDARDLLRTNGYEPQRLSAAKRHPDTGQLHHLSYRKVPELHPFEVTGTVLDDHRPNECQYHVHAFTVAGGIDWFSHYELRPDLFSPTFDPGRLREHYRPDYGETYLRGVTDLPLGGE